MLVIKQPSARTCRGFKQQTSLPGDLLQEQVYDFSARSHELRYPHVAVCGQLPQLVHVRQKLAQLQRLPAEVGGHRMGRLRSSR